MEYAQVYRISKKPKCKTEDLRKYALVKNMSDEILYQYPITFLSCIGYGGKNLGKYLEMYTKSGFTTVDNIKRDSKNLHQIVQ